MDAEYLFILTAVDHVAINYGKPNQKELQEMTLAEAERYCAEGQFAPGRHAAQSAGCHELCESGKGRKAIIASLEKAPEAIEGKSGTVIHMPKTGRREPHRVPCGFFRSGQAVSPL